MKQSISLYKQINAKNDHIPMLTKCKETVDIQTEFLCKNDELKLIFYIHCKERFFDTNLKPGANMYTPYSLNKKYHPQYIMILQKMELIPSQIIVHI